MRNLLFYPKLAVSGMQRNKILYVPYLLASSLMVMLFYILASMTFIIQRSDIVGGNSMALVLPCPPFCVDLSPSSSSFTSTAL